MTKTMTVDEAKRNFHEVTAKIKSRKNIAFKIVEKKSPIMAILSWEEYQGLLETLEILSDKELMKAVRQSIRDEKAGKGIPWSEAKKQLGW